MVANEECDKRIKSRTITHSSMFESYRLPLVSPVVVARGVGGATR